MHYLSFRIDRTTHSILTITVVITNMNTVSISVKINPCVVGCKSAMTREIPMIDIIDKILVTINLPQCIHVLVIPLVYFMEPIYTAVQNNTTNNTNNNIYIPPMGLYSYNYRYTQVIFSNIKVLILLVVRTSLILYPNVLTAF